MSGAAKFVRTTLFISVMILVVFFESSKGCMQTKDINKDKNWACWDLDRRGYISPDICCPGFACECDETGNYTSNARFGKDCKCNEKKGGRT